MSLSQISARIAASHGFVDGDKIIFDDYSGEPDKSGVYGPYRGIIQIDGDCVNILSEYEQEGKFIITDGCINKGEEFPQNVKKVSDDEWNKAKTWHQEINSRKIKQERPLYKSFKHR